MGKLIRIRKWVWLKKHPKCQICGRNLRIMEQVIVKRNRHRSVYFCLDCWESTFLD